MKRIICLIVTVLLLINIMPFAALAANGDARDNTQDDTINFTISEVTVDPGNTTQAVVYVDIANNPGFAGAELTIEYGENLTLLSVAKCDEFSQQFNLTVNKASGFVMLDNVSDVEGNGSLLTLTFSLNTSENKPTPEYNYDIDLSVKSLFDQDLDDIAYSVTPGKVIVKHDWTDATCTAPKTCKTCGATDGSESGHTEGEARKENVKPATDDKPGSYDKVVYCTVCGTEISRETITGVAKIGETCYGTLKEALDAAAKTGGETVTLVTDTTEDILMVPAGVTLDLEGNTVEVGVAVLGYGHIVDTDTVAGGIEIGADKIVHLQSDNPYMPLYDKATESYKFFKYEIETLSKNGTADTINLGVRVLFENREAYAVLANGETKTAITISLTWNGRTDSPIQHTVTEASVKEFGDKAFGQSENGSVTTAISINVKGLKSIAGKTLNVTAKLTSTTHVESAAKSFDAYNVPQASTDTETE
jgi:hypothetical protein